MISIEEQEENLPKRFLAAKPVNLCPFQPLKRDRNPPNTKAGTHSEGLMVSQSAASSSLSLVAITGKWYSKMLPSMSLLDVTISQKWVKYD